MRFPTLSKMNPILLGLVMVFIFLISFSPLAEARTCFCKQPTVDEDLKHSTAVFVGTVISAKEKKVSIQLQGDKGDSIPLYKDWAKIFEFEVEQSWKGASHSTLTITVPSGADCTYAHFREGERHLVYAYTNAPLNSFPGIGADT